MLYPAKWERERVMKTVDVGKLIDEGD